MSIFSKDIFSPFPSRSTYTNLLAPASAASGGTSVGEKVAAAAQTAPKLSVEAMEEKTFQSLLGMRGGKESKKGVKKRPAGKALLGCKAQTQGIMKKPAAKGPPGAWLPIWTKPPPESCKNFTSAAYHCAEKTALAAGATKPQAKQAATAAYAEAKRLWEEHA